MCVPYTDASLLRSKAQTIPKYIGANDYRSSFKGTGNAAQSPFVIAINRAGIKGTAILTILQLSVLTILLLVLPHIINAGVFTSAFSAGNSTHRSFTTNTGLKNDPANVAAGLVVNLVAALEKNVDTKRQSLLPQGVGLKYVYNRTFSSLFIDLSSVNFPTFGPESTCTEVRSASPTLLYLIIVFCSPLSS